MDYIEDAIPFWHDVLFLIHRVVNHLKITIGKNYMAG